MELFTLFVGDNYGHNSFFGVFDSIEAVYEECRNNGDIQDYVFGHHHIAFVQKSVLNMVTGREYIELDHVGFYNIDFDQ